MTNQELYSTSRQHLLKQGCKSFVERGTYQDGTPRSSCLYRGPNGTKCAIGVFIPDTAYSADLEGSRVCVEKVWQAAGLTRYQLELAASLQTIHDEVPVNRWETRLNKLAVRYKLEVR